MSRQLLALASIIVIAVTGRARGADHDYLRAIADQQNQLSNIEVISTTTVTLSPFVTGPPGTITIRGREVPLEPPRRGETVSSRVFRRAGHRAYYEIVPQSTTHANQAGAMIPSIFAYSTNRVEQLMGNSGVIRQTLPFPSHSIIDLALGFRERASESLLPTDAWLDFRVAEQDDNLVVVEHGPTEPLPGRFSLHRWVFDLTQGFALTDYKRLWKKGSQADWNTDIHVMNSDFRSVDGWSLPYSIESHMYHTPVDGAPVITQTTKVDVEAYTLFAVEDTDEAFMLKWPKGAVVVDDRNDNTYLIKDHDALLTDDYISAVYHPKTPNSERRGRWRWIVIFNVIGLGALAVYFWRLKKRPT